MADLRQVEQPQHVPRLGALPEAELSVGAGEDELVEEVGLPAADGTFGDDAAGDGAVEDLQAHPDGVPVPHPGRGRALVGGVGAGGDGQAAHAVAGEQPHPHVGVAGPAEGGVEPALLLEGRPVDHRGGHPDERGVAQDLAQGRPWLQVALLAEPLPAMGHTVHVDDVHAEQQDPLAGRRAADRLQDHRARARQEIVVVVKLQDPFAGRELHGPVDVPGQAQRRPVVHVPVPARPVGQQPPHHLAAGVVRPTRRTPSPRPARPRPRSPPGPNRARARAARDGSGSAWQSIAAAGPGSRPSAAPSTLVSSSSLP